MKLTKKGQLGWIEIRFFLYGLLVGILIALALVYLGAKGILPFKVPFVCG